MNILWDNLFLATPDQAEGFQRNTGEYIQTYKDALAERISAEHNFNPLLAAPQSSHGMHKEGSTICYHGTAEPTYRPDGINLLGANDVGRLWIDDDKLLHTWNGLAWIAVSATPIVGTLYIQLPLHESPAVLFPRATWQNVTASYAGLFFRAEGGNSAGWNVTQGSANLAHTHASPIPQSQESDTWTGDRTSFARTPANTNTVSQSPAGANESRPVNKSMRLWVRVA